MDPDNQTAEMFQNRTGIPTDVLAFNMSPTSLTNDTKGHADGVWDKNTRIIVLWVQIILGTIGGCIVCTWLWCNRSRKSRVNIILLHVTLSDLLVMGATLAQVIWEMTDRWWLAGEAMCRIVKFFQSFSMMSSSNTLVLLSIDRHQAIRSPLRNPHPVWKMALPCWLTAALLSTPMLFLYKVVFVTDENNIFFNKTACLSVLGPKSMIVYKQIFLTSVSFIHIFIPCIIIAVCYTRMFLKIAQKANTTGSTKYQAKPGKVHLQSTRSTSLPKAKIKTLKMTIVIVTAFIICGLPYHILEMFYNFGGSNKISPMLSAILGALPVANSVMNPYIFLLFSTNYRCLRGVVRPNAKKGYMDSRTEHTSHTQLDHTKVTSLKYTDLNSTKPEVCSSVENGVTKQGRNRYIPMSSINDHKGYIS